MSGVDGAVGSLHGRARGVLEGVSKSHDAGEPGLVADMSLGVLGDMELSELAESGQGVNLGTVLVVNSSVSVFVDTVSGERLNLHLSRFHGSAPVLNNLVLFSDSALGGMLGGELFNKVGASCAHKLIEMVSLGGSFHSDLANHSVVLFGGSVFH